MNEYLLRPAQNVDCALLRHRLAEMRVPFKEGVKKNLRLIRIGSKEEFDVAVATGRGNKISKASISIRYEHPDLKDILIRWLDDSGVGVHGDFYKSHFGLPPTVLESIRKKWRLNLEGLPVTPLKLCRHVALFMFGTNVSAVISAQLVGMPHTRLKEGEFVKCADWGVTGNGNDGTEVYRWRGETGEELLVTVWSAPATTLLSLWEISGNAPVQISIGKFRAE